MNALIRFGERVTLSNGQTPILRDFQECLGAFVEHEQPVEKQVFHREPDGRKVWEGPIHLGRRCWVDAPGYHEARDPKFGTKIGMAYKPEQQP